MDTQLSDMGQLELFRAEVAEGRMEPGSIVVNLDVFEHMRLGLFPCGEALAVDRFDLEAVVPAFHRGIVVAIALGAHAGDQSVLGQQGAMFTRAVLAAAVVAHDHAVETLFTALAFAIGTMASSENVAAGPVG